MVHECLVDGDVVDGEGQASALIAAEDELEDEHESKMGARAGGVAPSRCYRCCAAGPDGGRIAWC